MAKRKIVALYPVEALRPRVYCIDDQGDAWWADMLPRHPVAWEEWQPFPELPEEIND